MAALVDHSHSALSDPGAELIAAYLTAAQVGHRLIRFNASSAPGVRTARAGQVLPSSIGSDLVGIPYRALAPGRRQRAGRAREGIGGAGDPCAVELPPVLDTGAKMTSMSRAPSFPGNPNANLIVGRAGGSG